MTAQQALVIVFYMWLFFILLIGVLMWRGLIVRNKQEKIMLDMMLENAIRNTTALNNVSQVGDQLIRMVDKLERSIAHMVMIESAIEEIQPSLHELKVTSQELVVVIGKETTSHESP